MFCRQSHRGFTLVELLVVIAIIALLVGIVVPSMRQATEATRRAVCQAHLYALMAGMSSYTVENRNRTPVDDPKETDRTDYLVSLGPLTDGPQGGGGIYQFDDG